MALDYTSLLKKLTPDRDGEPHTHLRTGVVAAINSDGTLDITMSSGVLVPDVPKLDGVNPAVGAVVQMISFRGVLLVIGGVLGGVSATTGNVTQFGGSNPTTTSTTYTSLSGGDILGVAFVAPASGAVEVVVQGWLSLSSTTLQRRALMAPQVRLGGTINSGTIVATANDDYAALAQNSIVSAFDYKYVHHSRVVTGLTPGTTYNAVAMHRIVTSGDTSAANDRHITVKAF